MSLAPEYKINVKRYFIFVLNPNNRGFKKKMWTLIYLISLKKELTYVVYNNYL